MEAKVPSPQTTLLILLGASEWPLFPEFQSSKAFANAVRELKAYFLNPQPFGLPAENVLDLFDSEKGADELDVEMSQFLEQRLLDMKKAGHPARDMLLYFVGHGGFVGHDADFYLAIRRTRIDNPRASGLQVMALADMLTEHARFLRRIIILDCCFAAAAFSAFEAGPDQVAIEKTKEAFQVGHKAVGFPAQGTTLLCSSSHKTPSLLLPDGSSTMFAKALLDALVQGLPSPREYLTLRDVKDLAANLLIETRNAPKPVILSPDQSEGDVADIPFFPNPRAQEEQARQAEEAEWTRRMEERLRRAEEEQARQAEEERGRQAEEERRRLAEEATQPPKAKEPSSERTPQRPASTQPKTSTEVALPSKSPARAPGILIPVEPARPKRMLSRRTVIVGLAGLVVAGAAGGGLVWLTHSQQPVAPPVGYETPSLTQSPVGTTTQSPVGTTLYTYRGHSDGAGMVAWSPDGRRIASGSGDGTVQVWDASNGGNVYTYRGHSGGASAVAWSPDSRRIASAGYNDNTVQVWDASNGGNVYTYRGHSGVVWAVAWSPDGRRIASGSRDQTVQVWDASNGGNVYTYRGHSGMVDAVAWSPGGRRIASAGYNDNTVQVWDASNGGNVYTYRGHFSAGGGVRTVAWSPDGRRIASGSGDGTVQVWQAL